MTMRDLVLLADGLTEDAELEAEIARLPATRPPGALAETVRVPLDSTFLFGLAERRRAPWPAAPATRRSSRTTTC